MDPYLVQVSDVRDEWSTVDVHDRRHDAERVAVLLAAKPSILQAAQGRLQYLYVGVRVQHGGITVFDPRASSFNVGATHCPRKSGESA